MRFCCKWGVPPTNGENKFQLVCGRTKNPGLCFRGKFVLQTVCEGYQLELTYAPKFYFAKLIAECATAVSVNNV